MAVLTPSSAKGKTQFAAGGPQRTHDDTADRKVGSSYSHNPLEGSATEADEWVSWMIYATELLGQGDPYLPVRNSSGGTLTKGTLVRINGYHAASSSFTIAKADADDQYGAGYILDADIANSANGVAYKTKKVTGIDTSGRTVGDLLYLSSTAGAWTATLPSADAVVQQIVGVVTVVNATTGEAIFFPGSRNVLRPVVFTGDSGSGGKQGLVPAPGSGDAAANKYLKANGSWSIVNTSLASVAAYSSNWTTVNNSAVLTDVIDLSIQLPSTGKYIIRAHLIMNTTDPEGAKVDLVGPTASGVNLSYMWGGYFVNMSGAYLGSLGGGGLGKVYTGGGYMTLDITGGITVTDVTNPLKLQMCQDTAGAVDLIAYDNGFLEAVKVA